MRSPLYVVRWSRLWRRSVMWSAAGQTSFVFSVYRVFFSLYLSGCGPAQKYARISAAVCRMYWGVSPARVSHLCVLRCSELYLCNVVWWYGGWKFSTEEGIFEMNRQLENSWPRRPRYRTNLTVITPGASSANEVKLRLSASFSLLHNRQQPKRVGQFWRQMVQTRRSGGKMYVLGRTNNKVRWGTTLPQTPTFGKQWDAV